VRRILDNLPDAWQMTVKRAAYRAYLLLRPDDGPIWFRYGNQQWAAGNIRLAENAYQRALAIDPEMRRELVQHLIGLRRLEDALRFLDPALAAGDGWALASAARIGGLQSRLPAAQAILARAQGRALEEPSLLAEQGRVLMEEGQHGEALDLFERAQRIIGTPQTYWEERYWLLLALHRLNEAYALTRFRKRKTRLRLPPNVSLWQPGEAFDEAPFVLAEQGLGDEIKFASCYLDLLQDAPGAVIACHPRLRALFQRSFPGTRFVPVERLTQQQKRDASLLDASGWAALSNAKQCIVAADLLKRYRPSLASFAAGSPILTPDPQLKQKWRRRLDALGPGPKVGLSWTSLGRHPERMPRYTQLREWLPVLVTPGIQFVNLQHGAHAVDLALAERQGTPLHVRSDFDIMNDLDDLAALMSELDLVISAHSMTKELSGAVGARTWLVYHNADPQLTWRKREDGSDLWYTSIQHVVTLTPTTVEKAIAEVNERLGAEFG